MFAEPITLTVDSVDRDFARKQESGGDSLWGCQVDTTEENQMKIRHSELKATATAPKRRRHNAEFTSLVYATPTAAEVPEKIYLTMEKVPGDLNLERYYAFVAWLALPATAAKLLNGEP